MQRIFSPTLCFPPLPRVGSARLSRTSGCLEYTEAAQSGTKEQLSDGESLDEMLEQKVEVAGDREIGDEMSVSNGER